MDFGFVWLQAPTGSEKYTMDFVEVGHSVFTYLSGNGDGGTLDQNITMKEQELFERSYS